MHGAAAPGWIAAQRLREYVKLGKPDPTAKLLVIHAGQTLGPHVGGSKPLMTVVAPLSLARNAEFEHVILPYGQFPNWKWTLISRPIRMLMIMIPPTFWIGFHF
jgi:hypothetical protein